MKAKKTFETLEHLEDLLSKNKKVYYSRFGDGDIFIMMGRDTRNSKSYPKLKQELIDSFNIDHELYLKGLAVNYDTEDGMYDGVFKQFGYNRELFGWIKNNIQNIDDQYESAVMPHYMSVFKQDKFKEFLNTYIKNKSKMVIGSVKKSCAEKLLGNIDYYITVPEKESYSTIDTWYKDILRNIDNVDMILPFTGFPTRVLSKRLWNLGIDIHFLDLGSIIDAVCGKETRTWIKKEKDKIKNLI